MKIAVVHNLPSGGAHRRLGSQMKHLQGELTEICLQTATPITSGIYPLAAMREPENAVVVSPLVPVTPTHVEQTVRSLAD